MKAMLLRDSKLKPASLLICLPPQDVRLTSISLLIQISACSRPSNLTAHFFNWANIQSIASLLISKLHRTSTEEKLSSKFPFFSALGFQISPLRESQ